MFNIHTYIKTKQTMQTNKTNTHSSLSARNSFGGGMIVRASVGDFVPSRFFFCCFMTFFTFVAPTVGLSLLLRLTPFVGLRLGVFFFFVAVVVVATDIWEISAIMEMLLDR